MAEQNQPRRPGEPSTSKPAPADVPASTPAAPAKPAKEVING